MTTGDGLFLITSQHIEQSVRNQIKLFCPFFGKKKKSEILRLNNV